MNVAVKNIHKHFGRVRANDGISLEVPSGTIQGILGENGAGKSTLMKILSGYQRADSGEIFINGKPVVIRCAADAIRAGIGMLHQDPMDFPPMSVLENFLVGHDGGKRLHRKQARGRLDALAREFSFTLDLRQTVGNLTIGERQQLELLRLLAQGASVLILDEPTTGISGAQREALFATLKRLANDGKTILFVSHKLDEVARLCDRVAVLRHGRLVGTVEPPYDTSHLVRLMFGREISAVPPKPVPIGEPVLALEDLTLDDGRLEITDINLEVREGEVLGLAGMEGSGQRTLLRACAGLVRPSAGRVLVKGENLAGRSYQVFHEHGVAYVPAARLEEGLIPGLTLAEHVILAEPNRSGFIDWGSGERATQERIEQFNVRGRPSTLVEALSGGNQQRALLALVRSPVSVLLLEHPTRGLDVESSMYIWSKLRARLEEGTGIVFISAELEELLTYATKIAVFFAGRMAGPFPATDLSVEDLGQLIGGRSFNG